MSHEPLPDDVQQRIVADYQAGHAIRAVALRNGVGARRVRTVLADRNVPLRPAYQPDRTHFRRATYDGAAILREHEAGDTWATIAARHSIHPDQAREYVRRHQRKHARQAEGRRPGPKPWSDDTAAFDEAAAMYQAGASLVEVAAHFGVSTHTVWKPLKEAGLTRPRGRPPGRGSGVRPLDPAVAAKVVVAYQAGGSLVDVARDHHVSQARVRKAILDSGGTLRPSGTGRPARMPRKLDGQESRVIAAYKEGGSLEFVAKRFGVSPTAVHRVLADAGVPRRAPGGWNRGQATGRRQTRPRSRAEREIIADYESGLSMLRVAARYHMSIRTVQKVLASR